MYTVYHIPGVKVGCSKRVEARVKEQGYNVYEVLEVCLTAREASEKELRWQEQLGYGRDNFSTYLDNLKMAAAARNPQVIIKRAITLKQTIKTSEKWKASRLKNIKSCHTREIIQKRALKQKKVIIQLDLNNNFIKEWSSAIDIQRALGIKNSDICTCCKGRQKTAKGFIWKYKN
jgi:hypothetical protein